MAQSNRGQKTQRQKVSDLPPVSPPSRWSKALVERHKMAKRTPRPTRTFEVRATRLGYYGDRRRREGDVFEMEVPLGPRPGSGDVKSGEPDFPAWVEPTAAALSGYSVSSGRSDEDGEG